MKKRVNWKTMESFVGCAICAAIATGVIMFIAMGCHSVSEIHAGQKLYHARNQMAQTFVPQPTIIDGE
jgi:uncharacterized membrane protein